MFPFSHWFRRGAPKAGAEPTGSRPTPRPSLAKSRPAIDLPRADPARLAELRAQVDTRAIDYPYGAGEAEEVALLAGLKPIVRQFLRRGELDEARARYEALGFAVAVEKPFMQMPFDGLALHVGRDAARVTESARLDGLEARHDEALGEMLGFPPCCVAAFRDVPTPRRIGQFHGVSLARTRGRLEPRLNVLDLGMFHYPSWVPCSLDCAPSLAYVNALHAALLRSRPSKTGLTFVPEGEGSPAVVAFLRRMDEALGAARLFVRDDVQLSLAGAVVGGGFKVERVWATAMDRHPKSPLKPEAAELVASLWAALDGVTTISVEDDVLVADGKAVFSATDLLLVPFSGDAGVAARQSPSV